MVCLELLASRPAGVTFSDFTQACGGLPPASMSRLLKSLQSLDVVERTEERVYRQGPRLRSLLERDPRAQCQTELTALAQAVGESVALFVPAVGGVRLAAKADREERFHFMAVGGTNQNSGHGANRLLALGRDELVNRDDDQLGVTRICVACRGQDGVIIGVVCITLVSASLDADTEKRCLAASRKTAAAIASFIPSLS